MQPCVVFSFGGDEPNLNAALEAAIERFEPYARHSTIRPGRHLEIDIAKDDPELKIKCWEEVYEWLAAQGLTPTDGSFRMGDSNYKLPLRCFARFRPRNTK